MGVFSGRIGSGGRDKISNARINASFAGIEALRSINVAKMG
jgi:hypothetical protein